MVYAGTILSHPFFVRGLLPFLLVFTVVFGVLQKSEVLGKGKKQIDALVALAVGLILVSALNAVDMILQLVSFLSVALVVGLVFMLLIGMTGKEGDYDNTFNKTVKKVIGIPLIIAFFIAVLSIVGAWDYVLEKIMVFGDSDTLVYNLGFIVIIAAAIYAVLSGAGSSSSASSEKKPS